MDAEASGGCPNNVNCARRVYDAQRFHLAPAPVLARMNLQPLEAVKDLFELLRVVSIGEVHSNDCIHSPVSGGGFGWTSLAASTCRISTGGELPLLVLFFHKC